MFKIHTFGDSHADGIISHWGYINIPNVTIITHHLPGKLMYTFGRLGTQLLNIKNLLELPIENISTPSGIYFLCKENKIKYIGQSNYITGRVTQHIAEGIKDFSNVFFISCPSNKLNELETLLIRHFQPELNKKSIGKFNTSYEDNKVFELINDL